MLLAIQHYNKYNKNKWTRNGRTRIILSLKSKKNINSNESTNGKQQTKLFTKLHWEKLIIHYLLESCYRQPCSTKSSGNSSTIALCIIKVIDAIHTIYNGVCLWFFDHILQFLVVIIASFGTFKLCSRPSFTRTVTFNVWRPTLVYCKVELHTYKFIPSM